MTAVGDFRAPARDAVESVRRRVIVGHNTMRCTRVTAAGRRATDARSADQWRRSSGAGSTPYSKLRSCIRCRHSGRAAEDRRIRRRFGRCRQDSGSRHRFGPRDRGCRACRGGPRPQVVSRDVPGSPESSRASRPRRDCRHSVSRRHRSHTDVNTRSSMVLHDTRRRIGDRSTFHIARVDRPWSASHHRVGVCDQAPRRTRGSAALRGGETLRFSLADSGHEKRPRASMTRAA